MYQRAIYTNIMDLTPITIRIENDNIKIYNSGGPDRSIKLEDLQKGTAVASRYRNRRLGDFLKEMDLSEGRSTGLSLIYAELARNGSPRPLIETDEERSFFRVTFFIHPAFETFKWEVREPQLSLTQKLSALTDSNGQADKIATLLMLVRNRPLERDKMLKEIGLTNHTENARRYIAPLETAGFIEKTLPDKPTSPKQRYKITAKGIRILSFVD